MHSHHNSILRSGDSKLEHHNKGSYVRRNITHLTGMSCCPTILGIRNIYDRDAVEIKIKVFIYDPRPDSNEICSEYESFSSPSPVSTQHFDI
jgi:hypothetical protein